MENTRRSILRAIWKYRVVRYGTILLGAMSAWDVGSNQFGLPKIPRIWDKTGALLPLWVWSYLLLLLFVYGLFEYVRLNIPPDVTDKQIKKSPTKPAPEQHAPDIKFSEILHSLMHARGVVDDGSQEAFDKIQEIAQEISDQMFVRYLNAWGRMGAGSPLRKIPINISRMGVGVSRTSSGELHCAISYRAEGLRQCWIYDVSFMKKEVRPLWPEINSKVDA
ncbi:hypothetical protein MKP08_08330 [Erythrobacter sp. LQ02-29]|uniref:hypothetical protein n=1 Tax=Erythrobacter sp. LQ02-29 TaxID=2920384 RepID=UPI001F4F0E83|nr:hypothetical protein [Erythrobacter sp. LQ02-29]MCP9222750.1 hypothetical protein [Erythrobacter sp. LQ02-29]